MAGGSIKQDGDGWMFVIDVPSPDGRRRQVRRRGFERKKAAEKELRSVLGVATVACMSSRRASRWAAI